MLTTKNIGLFNLLPELTPVASYDNPLVVEIISAIVGKVRIFDRELLRHSSATEKKIGVTTTELLFLGVVDGKPGIRLIHVTEKLCIQQATSSNIMRSLVEKDLVEKKPDPEDGRGVRLHLTRLGKETLEKGKSDAVKGPLREAALAMSIEDLAMLNKLLGQITGTDCEPDAETMKRQPARRKTTVSDAENQAGKNQSDRSKKEPRN